MISPLRFRLDQALASPYFKAGLLVPLGIAIVYLLSRAVTVLSAGFTIGLLVRESLPIVLALGLFLLVWAGDLRGLVAGLTFRGFGLAPTALLLALAIPIAFVVVHYVSLYPPTFFLVGGLALAGLLISLFLALTSDGAEAVISFLLAYPFLAYLEAEPNFQDLLVSSLTVGPFSYTPTLAFIWLLFLAVLLRRVVTRQALTRTSLDFFILAWLFVLFLSSLNSRLPEESLQDFLIDLTLVLLFFVVTNRARTKKDLLALGASLLVAALLRLSVLLYFYRQWFQSGLDIGVVSSLFKLGVHMGTLGWLATVALPLSIAFFVLLRDPRLRLALASAAALSVVALLAIRLRSAVIAALVPVPFLMLYLRQRSTWAVGSAVGLVVGGLVVSAVAPAWLERFSSWTSLEAVSEEQAQRLDNWQATIRMSLDHPVLGVGLRMWQDYAPQYLQRDWEGQMSFGPHQMLLHYLSAGGFGALLALIGLHVVALRTAWSLARKTPDEGLRPVAMALCWIFTSMVASGMIGGAAFLAGYPQGMPPGAVDAGLSFWLVLGTIFALSKLGAEQGIPSRGR